MTPYTRTHSLAYRAVVAFWLACLLYSVFGRLFAATIVGEANVQHQGCVTVYAPDRSYRRLQQADCIFGNGF